MTTLGDHLGASLDDLLRSTSAVDTNSGAVDLVGISRSLTAGAEGDRPLLLKDVFTVLELGVDVDSASAEVFDHADFRDVSCEEAALLIHIDTRVVKDR